MQIYRLARRIELDAYMEHPFGISIIFGYAPEI